MSGPFGSSQWMYSSGGFYEFPIEQSLKFNDNDSSYLQWTPASAGNRKTWTWSGWVKRGNISLSAPATLFSAGTGGAGDSARLCLQFKQDDTLITDMGGIGQYNQSNSVYRDTSAWYHIVWKFDVTQSTAADRSILYVNGERISDQNLRSFTQNADHQVNAATVHRMGALTNVLTHWADLYLAEVNFIDGQALDASSFGEFKSGVWIPKDPSNLTYGTNGFRLSFQNDTVSEGFNTVTYRGTGATQSINGVGFAPDLVWCKTRTAANDHNLSDSVRGATKFLHSNKTDAESTYAGAVVSFDSDGFTVGDGAQLNQSGQAQVAWCWDAGSENNWAADFDGSNDDVTGTLASGIGTGDFTLEYWVRHDTLTDYQTHFSTTRGSTGFNVGTDASGDMVWYSSSARQLETIGAISTGTWYHWAFVRSSGTLKSYLNGVEQDSVANTENFSATAFSIGALDSGSEFANCRISNLRLTNTAVYTANFTPPTSNLTAISGTILLTLQDGTFKDNSGNNTVVSGNNGVFLAQNNQNSENTDGSITSTVKANAAYGFSVVSYVGNSTNGATVGHGLGQKPKMIIVKNRNDGTKNWAVYHEGIGASKWLKLNLTDAAATDPIWASTEPTSSVFYLNSTLTANDNGDNFIAYCFADVAGYSKVGSYTGTGANGNAISLGWKPAFVLVKKSSNTGAWSIFDANRYDADNNYHLNANTSDAEYTDMVFQFTDTGFTVGSTGGMNHSGETFVYLAIKDTRDNAFWRDQSGNGNDWQPNNLTYQDSLLDAPTNNFAVLNAIWQGSANQAPLSEGNLQANSSGEQATFAIPSSGKWYWEVDIRNSNGYTGIGFTNGPYSQYLRWNVAYGSFTNASAGTLNVGTQSSYADCLVMIAWDADNDEFYMGVNGSWFGGGNPAAGTNSTLTLNTSSTGIWIPEHNLFNGGTAVYNFGQDSSFAGIKAAQGNTDDNGIGDFYYAPPSGYLALCTANLPDPVIDPAKDDVPSDYFNTVTYNNTGTSYPKSVTGIGFQPDLIWVKSRTQAYDHYLFDAVRGTGAKKLSSNTTAAEGSDSTSISSFDSDGYTISSGAGIGDITGVTWSWLAGNGTSSNTSGSITSTVSVNQKAGFSIVSYIGTGANATVGHGLGAAPSMIILKNRDASWAHWGVYHKDQGAVGSGHLYSNALNLNVAVSLSSIYWNNTAPTSSVFSIGTDGVTNNSGDDYIAYCFAEVEGYSKFGSYTGNGSTDGPMLYLGFEPAFFLAKRTDGVENWFMIDNARHPYNDGNIPRLLPNTADAESEDASIAGDFLSNGFKIRATQNMINTSGANYIYMAFAESPFKYSNAR